MSRGPCLPNQCLVRTLALLGAVLLIASACCGAEQAGDGAADHNHEHTHPENSRDWFQAWCRAKEQMRRRSGTSVGLCAITTSQVVLNGRGEGKGRTVFWWNLSVTQNLWRGAKLITNTRGGTGNGLNVLVGSKHDTNWMQHEYRCVYVSHLYLEQKLLGDKLTLAAGKLDTQDYFDTNEAASWDFLSYSLARNPTVPCRWHVLGALARVDVAPWLYVQAAAADAEGRWTETGFQTAFHGKSRFFSLYELGLKPKFAGREGNYRFILWQEPQPQQCVDGNGTQRDDVGFAVSFDQQVADGVTAFVRYGLADPGSRQVEHFWSVGAAWAGPIPGRKGDVLAVGVGQSIMGADHRRATNSAPAETLFEAYYKIRITDWCFLTPDLQLRLKPGADRSADTSVIAGLKLCIKL